MMSKQKQNTDAAVLWLYLLFSACINEMHETLFLTFFIYQPTTLIKSNIKSKICILNWCRLTLFSTRLASFFIVLQSWSLDYTGFLNVNVFIHYGWFKHCCLNGAVHGLKVTHTASVACIAACLRSKHCSTIFWSNQNMSNQKFPPVNSSAFHFLFIPKCVRLQKQ